MTAGPKRAGRPGAINSIGLTGAPAAAAPVAPVARQAPAPIPAPSAPLDADRPVPRFEAPSATAPSTTSYTLRLHQADAAEVDLLRVRLRGETGRRNLDQAAIVRTLLRMAIDDDTIRAALLRELKTS